MLSSPQLAHLAISFMLFSGNFILFSSPVFTVSAVQAQSDAVSGSLSLAVLPFENLTRQPADEWMGLSFAESLTGTLAKVPALRVIERNQLKRVLTEQNFSQSALVDSSQAPALGKLVGAKRMVVGHFQKVGDQLRIQARVIQVETGEVLPDSVVQVEGNSQAYFSLLDQLSEQLSQKFQPHSKPILTSNPHLALAQEAQSLYYRGLYLLENGDTSQQLEAEALFQKALSINPQDALVQAGLAQYYLNKGRTGEGESALAKASHWADSALTLNPQLQKAWQIKLEISEYRRDPVAGEQILQAALKVLPGNTELILAYLTFLDNQNLFSNWMTSAELKEQYQRLGANLQDPQILLNLGTHLLNENHGQRKPDYSEALAVLTRARIGLPDNPTIPLYLGDIYLALNDPEKAQREIETALALDPHSQWIHLMAHNNLINLGFHYRQNNAPEKALSYFEKALKLAQELTKMAPQNVFYLLKVADDFDKLGRTEAALQSLEQARKLNPNHPNLYTFELKLYKKAQNWEAALKSIAKGIEVCLAAPQNFSGILPQLYYEKAFVLRRQGKADEALVIYQEVRQNFEGFRNVAIQDMIAIYQEKNKFEEALQLYQALFNLDPSLAEEEYYSLDYKRSWILAELHKTPRSAPLLNELAQLSIQQGELKFAQQTFQQALAIEPENAIILYNFGSFSLGQSALEDAKTALEKALKNQPKYINAAYNLGLTYLALNKKAEAKTLFEQILNWQPGHAGATEALKSHFR
ncbi:MAG: tetratricopeptide repeat protein [Candidatus Sericytochromatia bacterium]|nr:tetratricopeptide repeat protein [Candidatus Sericytochromatia bacterium]